MISSPSNNGGMEVKLRNIETKKPKMSTHRFTRLKDHGYAKATGHPVTWKLFLFVLSIPLGALYVGYAIGNHLMAPPPRFPARGVVVDIGRLNYSWYNSHNVTVLFDGGLGNQMFQYASLYGIGKANGLRPCLTADSRLYDAFPFIRARPIRKSELVRDYDAFSEFGSARFDGRTFSLNFMKNIRLEGYYQSWRYFDHVRADVRRQFRFRPEVERSVAEALADVRRAHAERADAAAVRRNGLPLRYVGVHIRRGDFLEPQNVDKGYTTADTAFLDRAMRYYDVTYKNVVYVVCTEDVDWARANVNTTSSTSVVVLSPFGRRHPVYDLALLASCNHSIITVGTFGWWGAWLAAGDVIYYKNYPRPASSLAKEFSPNDYYLPAWIGI